MDKTDFKVLPAGEMRKQYGLIAENRQSLALDCSNVPAPLRGLIPLAEEFGIGDDLIRHDLVAKCDPSILADMRNAVFAHDDELDAWLAGPAANGPTFSAEYIAFTCLRMAADGC